MGAIPRRAAEWHANPNPCVSGRRPERQLIEFGAPCSGRPGAMPNGCLQDHGDVP